MAKKTCFFTAPITPATNAFANVTVTTCGLVSAATSQAAYECMVTQTGTPTITSGSNLTWNSSVRDVNSMFNGSDTITAPITGTYVISYACYFSTTAISDLVKVTAGGTDCGGCCVLDAAGNAAFAMTTVARLSAGATIVVKNACALSKTFVAGQRHFFSVILAF